MRSFPRSQSGFTLLEVLLAIGVSLSIGAVALTEMRRDNESKQARAVGQQMAQVGKALNAYVALHYDDLVLLEEQAGVGTADDPGPRHCTPNATTVDSQPTSICTITTETLRRAGLLPRNFSGRNAYGAEYEIYIRVIGAGPNYIVDGLAVTDAPYTTGAGNRYDLLGQAMQEAGADSGMTRTLAATMEGLNGTWRDASWPSVTHPDGTHPGVNQLGLLGYRVGYGSSGYAAYLRLDGTIPMVGDLDMGDHNIQNVDLYEGNAARLTASGETLALNAPTATHADRTAFVTGAGTLGIRANSGVSIQRHDGTGAALAAGSLTALDNILSSNGDISAPNGEISARDLIATNNAEVQGNINVGGDAFVGDDLSVAGDATVAGTVAATNLTATNQVQAGTYTLDSAGMANGANPAWFYDTAVAAWRVAGGWNANVRVDGVMRAGRVTSEGRISGLDGLQLLGNTVTMNAGCTEVGTMARDTSGDLVQCMDSSAGGLRWSPMGVRTTGINSAAIVSPGGGAFAEGMVTCPAGTTLIGGGYWMAVYSPDGGGLDSASPARSYPSGNAWVLRTAPDNGSGTTFYARALCAY